MAEDWLSSTLVSLTGTADVKLAAARLAEQALASSGNSSSVLEIALRHNVLPLIREVVHGPSGSVSAQDGSFVISLNSNDNEARRRFTIAHEIGHVLIAQASGRKLHETGDIKTERLLDEFASRLVCPDRALAEWFKSVNDVVSIKTLETASKRLSVSMTVLVKRLGQGDLLDSAEKGVIIGSYARSWKGKSQFALRVRQAATPTWGFIPKNRRFSSIGLGGVGEVFEKARSRQSTSGVSFGRVSIVVKEKMPTYRWATIETDVEQKTYRVRTTGEYFAVVIFDWPRRTLSGEE